MAHFSSCGSSVLTAVFVAAAQLLTAAVTLFVLKRRLLRGQRLAVRNRSEPAVALHIMKMVSKAFSTVLIRCGVTK